jgi:large subunit ribosomal protein L12
MEYVYTALLLHNAKQEVNEANVKKVVEAAGITPDDAKIKALIASLDGVNIDEAITKAAVVPVAAAAAPAATEKKKEEKKDEKSDEQKEEEAAGGLAALFG